ncbi:peptidoglycan recognition protein [Streptomyces sp. NPDC058001]|uniref:peptidoglycan recognition protein family protein n=1 Tax=Streptomyces sp. NPDC058001 TaxID=3346300 RepID=UPI0036E2A9C3
MRGFLASSIGVTCLAALALPLAQPTGARATTPAAPAAPAAPGAPAAAAPSVPGSTQSLPLSPLSTDRSLPPGAQEQGLSRRDVRPFSLVGVVWDDPAVELDGQVQVRTRATATASWSGWQDVETHNHEHAADPGSDERESGRVRGSTAPLWVGDSDAVEVRVSAPPHDSVRGMLPAGLRLELVDPGNEPAATRSVPESAVVPESAEVLPEESAAAERARPYTAPRPRVVTRWGWGADERLRQGGFAYAKSVRAAFVHHSGTGNNYRCSQAPSVIRGIYRYHVKSSGWRDIGYNYLVDKCGNVYEGRAGGVTKAVLGAHTLGFNSNTMGVAVLGTFSRSNPPAAAVNAVAKVTAWKLGLFGANPRGKTYLTSGGGNLYRKGKKVRLNVISGHRDGFVTDCPGARLYGKLGTVRGSAARLQGR